MNTHSKFNAPRQLVENFIIWPEDIIESPETYQVDGNRLPSSTFVRMSPSICRAVAAVVSRNIVLDASWNWGQAVCFHTDEASILREKIGWIAMRYNPEDENIVDFLCYDTFPLAFADADSAMLFVQCCLPTPPDTLGAIRWCWP